MNKNKKVLKKMETYPMFMNRKSQYSQGISSSQLDP